jgi:hypothetical protein
MTAANDRIRALLLASKGARQCRHCPVIIQGGPDAYRMHLQVCHPDRRLP